MYPPENLTALCPNSKGPGPVNFRSCTIPVILETSCFGQFRHKDSWVSVKYSGLG